MSQKHDIGWKKRQRSAPTRQAPIDAYRLARDLVTKGLAPAVILGPMKAHNIKDDK